MATAPQEGQSISVMVSYYSNNRIYLGIEEEVFIQDDYYGFPDSVKNKSIFVDDTKYTNFKGFVDKDSIYRDWDYTDNKYLSNLLFYNSRTQTYQAEIICNEPNKNNHYVLTYEGLKYLWSKVSLEDYPNNETLIAILEAIDQAKADQSDLDSLHNLVGDTPVNTQISTATNNLSEELKEYIDETFLGGAW